MPKKRTDGEGAVYQVHRKDCDRPEDARGQSRCKCPWRGAIVTGYKNNGKTAVRKTVSGSSRSAVAVKVRELNEKRAANELPVGKPPTLEQWLNHCHRRLLPGKVKESTLVTYRGQFDNYLIPLLGQVRLDRLTAEHIEDAWTTLAEIGNPLLDKPRPLSANTIHSAHAVLRRMLRLAVQRKKIRTNPAGPDSMDAPPKQDVEVEPLATEQWRSVLEVAPTVPDTARWTVALAMGLRQGEALGLRWKDLDFETGTLWVRQIVFPIRGKGLVFTTPKTKGSQREIVLPTELLTQLKAHRKAQAAARLAAGDHWQDYDLVFCRPNGAPMDPSDDRKHWKALLALAGVPPIKLHAARHTAATVMLLQGIDRRVVMSIMGWSQIATAANYQHAVDEAKQAAAATMGAAMFGTPS